jgi:hypothetical protein
VEGLLVDPDQMRVRYLDVDIADDLFHLREDRHVVVPMEFVELRERGRDVWVKGLTAHEIALLPAYTGGPLDPLVEQRVEHAFQRQPEPNALPPSHRATGVREDSTVDLPPHDSRVDLPPPPDDLDDEPPHARQREAVPPPDYPDDEHYRDDAPPPLPPRRDADY